MSRHNIRSKGKYVRADGTTRSDAGLLAMGVEVTRHCVVCGQMFTCYGGSKRLTCSPKCITKRWRAIGMLAGTHGYVDGQFRRL